MDPNTGRIFDEEEMKELSEEFQKKLIPLKKKPDDDCPICKGKGHTGLKFRFGVWRYEPCECTLRDDDSE